MGRKMAKKSSGKILKISFERILIFLVFSPFFSCAVPSARFEKILGTVCIVNLYESGKTEIYDEIFDRLDEIDDEFNLMKGTSDISRINSSAFSENVVVGEDIFSVISTAQFISSLTDGAFDISVEPIVNLWHINTDSPHIASQEELDDLLPLVNFKNISLDYEKKSVRFLKDGMEIDLGGIAKGFAADEIIKICKKHKIKRAVIDLGGNVYVYGKKSRGLFGGKKSELWNVGVKNPEFPDSEPLLKLLLPEMSVVTSGVYERFFKEGEKRYHHILSPKTGFPAATNLYSVTVLCENSMVSDALSTAFFVLGKEKSLSLLPTVNQEFKDFSGISCIFIEENHKITLSENFPYKCDLLTDGWELIKN